MEPACIKGLAARDFSCPTSRLSFIGEQNRKGKRRDWLKRVGKREKVCGKVLTELVKQNLLKFNICNYI